MSGNLDYLRDTEGALKFFDEIEFNLNSVKASLKSVLTIDDEVNNSDVLNVEMLIFRVRLMRNLLLNFTVNMVEMEADEMLRLRPSQLSALNNLYGFLKNLGEGSMRGYFRQPTGAGKTVLMGTITKLLGQKTLILVPNTDLLIQTKQEFVSRLCIPETKIGLVGGGYNDFANDIIVVTYSSFIRRSEELLIGRNLVICDEVHRGLGDKTQDGLYGSVDRSFEDEAQFGSVIDLNGVGMKIINDERLVLGFTATPDLRDKKVKEYFRTEIASVGYSELIKAGILKKINLLFVQAVMKESDFEFIRDDFSLEKELELLKREDVYKKLLTEWEELRRSLETKGQKLNTAVFCPTTEQCLLFKDLAALNGRKAVVITAEYQDMPLDKAEASLLCGDIDMIVTVNKLSEGWNFPNLNCVVLARATMSSVKILQPIGRALRSTGLVDEQAYVIETQWKKMTDLKSVDNFEPIKNNNARENSGDFGGEKGGRRSPMGTIEAFIKLGEELNLKCIFGNYDEIARKQEFFDDKARMKNFIKEKILCLVSTPELWAGMKKADRKSFKICEHGLKFIARIFDVQGDPIRKKLVHFQLGQAIYGVEHDCLRIVENLEPSTDEVKSALLIKIPNAQIWANMKSEDRAKFKVNLNGKDRGLQYVAKKFGIYGDPSSKESIHFELGQRIYGSNNQCLKVIDFVEPNLEDLRAAIVSLVPTFEDWKNATPSARKVFKVIFPGKVYGLMSLCTKFGVMEGSPYTYPVYLELGRKIFNQT